ncbi:MAG: universal stress protein [Helicobacteraceae bacterium]|jgi:nucleotide-binding universal stress UspA family protein|nr:universal stress protein [Helicobacteraceae bacterium]
MKILAATDFSKRGDVAVERAIKIAKNIGGGSLTVLHAINSRGFFGAVLGEKLADQGEKIKAKLEANLAEIAAKSEAKGVKIKAKTAIGDPHEVIAETADQIGADLIVIGDHGGFAPSKLLGGTTAQNAIDGAKSPVLIAKSPDAENYAQILIATDFSEPSWNIARAVLRLFPAAQISLVSLYLAPAEFESLYYDVNAERVTESLETMRAETTQKLEDFRSQLNFPPATRLLSRASAYPAETLAEIASEYDLIALGTRGTHTSLSIFLGSTAEFLIRERERDILVLRS